MMNPIQQNVVFKSNNTANTASNFGSVPKSVRGDYASTVNDVSSMQVQMNNACKTEACGNNLNTIA